MTQVEFIQRKDLFNFTNLMWKVLVEAIRLFSSLVIFIGISVIVLIVSPILLIRLIVSVLAKYLRSDLSEMIDAHSSLYATDDIYSNPKSSLVISVFLDRKADLELIRQNFTERLINSPQCGKFKNVTHFPQQWLGFFFWVKESQFDISNHIYEYQDDSVCPPNSKIYGDKDLDEIRSGLLTKSYDKGKSLWEFIVVNNYYKDHNVDDNDGDFNAIREKSKSVVLLRYHHIIGDGVSCINMIFPSVGTITPNFNKPKNFLDRIIATLTFIAYAPIELFTLHFCLPIDKNCWHKNQNQLSKEYHTVLQNGLPISDIKTIKNHFKVNFQAVIYAAIAGSVRNTMLELKLKVPNQMTVLSAVPIPGHRDKLSNHFGVCSIILPTGEADLIERLRLTDASLVKIKNSTMPFASFLTISLLGQLFSWMMKPLTAFHPYTLQVGSFPVSTERRRFLDDSIVSDLQFSVGLSSGSMGIGFYVATYEGQFGVNVVLDKNIHTVDKYLANKLTENFVKEIHRFNISVDNTINNNQM